MDNIDIKDIKSFKINKDISGLRKGWVFKRQSNKEAFDYRSGLNTTYRIYNQGVERLFKESKIDIVSFFSNDETKNLYSVPLYTSMSKSNGLMDLINKLENNTDKRNKIKNKKKLHEVKQTNTKLQKELDSANIVIKELKEKESFVKDYTESIFKNILTKEEKINSLIEYYQERYNIIEVLDELEFDKKEEKNVLWNIIHVLKYIQEND